MIDRLIPDSWPEAVAWGCEGLYDEVGRWVREEEGWGGEHDGGGWRGLDYSH